jgi:hypothetical protein
VLWGEEQYYRVRLQADEQLEAALEQIPNAAELVRHHY